MVQGSKVQRFNVAGLDLIELVAAWPAGYIALAFWCSVFVIKRLNAEPFNL